MGNGSRRKTVPDEVETEAPEQDQFTHMETNPVQADAVPGFSSEHSSRVRSEASNTTLVRVAEELQHELTAKVDKQDFYKYLGLSMDKYDLDMDVETANKYKRHIMSLKHGMHAGVPLVCYGGKKCVIGSRCPFTKFKANNIPDYDGSTYPVFRPCPVETDMVKMHMMNLIEEYNVEPDDFTDIAIISKLATLDILEYRCNMALATDSQGIVISEVSTVDYTSGKEFITRRINPAFEVMEKIHKMRNELVKSMVGTRREKYKAAAATGEKKITTGLTQDLHDLVQLIQNQKAEEDILDVEEDVLDVQFQGHASGGSDEEDTDE